MFDLVGIFSAFGFHLPRVFAGDGIKFAAVKEVGSALAADGVVGDAGPATWAAVAFAKEPGSAGVFPFHGEVVEEIAIVGTTLAEGPHAVGADWISAVNPVGDVDAVDEVVDDEIGREPGEVVPIAALVLQFGELRFPDKARAQGCVGEGACVDDLAQLSRVDAFDHFLKAPFVAALEAHGDLEVLFAGRLCSGKNAAYTRGIDCDGFFEKGVFSKSHGFFEMGWAKGAGRCEDDDICGCDRLFVGIKPHELPFRRDVDTVAITGFECVETDGEFVGKQVCHCHEFDVWICRQRLVCGAGPATAAADKREFERFDKAFSKADGWKTGDRSGGDCRAGAEQKGASFHGERGGMVHERGRARPGWFSQWSLEKTSFKGFTRRCFSKGRALWRRSDNFKAQGRRAFESPPKPTLLCEVRRSGRRCLCEKDGVCVDVC